MSGTSKAPVLCIKPLLVKLPYVCGVCNGTAPAEVGFYGFLNGKVFVEGTENPVCEDCCQQHAPYLYTLCKLEDVVEKSYGFNDTEEGNRQNIDLILNVNEDHSNNALALKRKYEESEYGRDFRRFESLVTDEKEDEENDAEGDEDGTSSVSPSP